MRLTGDDEAGVQWILVPSDYPDPHSVPCVRQRTDDRRVMAPALRMRTVVLIVQDIGLLKPLLIHGAAPHSSAATAK